MKPKPMRPRLKQIRNKLGGDVEDQNQDQKAKTNQNAPREVRNVPEKDRKLPKIDQKIPNAMEMGQKADQKAEEVKGDHEAVEDKGGEGTDRRATVRMRKEPNAVKYIKR